MLTSFGKFLRKLRIDRGELLKDMADNLGVTSSYLSAVENGKRNVPQKWVKQLIEKYDLNEGDQEVLKSAVEESKFKNKVDVSSLKNSDKNLMMALARSIDSMDEKDKIAIRSLLHKKE